MYDLFGLRVPFRFGRESLFIVARRFFGTRTTRALSVFLDITADQVYGFAIITSRGDVMVVSR